MSKIFKKPIYKMILLILFTFCMAFGLSSCSEKGEDISVLSLKEEICSNLQNDKLKFDFKTDTTYDGMFNTVIKSGTNEKVQPPKRDYVLVDLDKKGTYDVSISIKNKEEVSSSFKVNVTDSISRDEISALFESDKIKITLPYKGEGVTYYCFYNKKVASSNTNIIEIPKSAINYQTLTCQYRYERENNGVKTYNVSMLSKPLQINVCDSSSLELSPLSSSEYVLKTNSLSNFELFDFDVKQENKVILSTKGAKAADIRNNQLKFLMKDVLNEKLTVSAYFHGSKSETTLVPDIKIEKEYNYTEPINYSIKNQKIILDYDNSKEEVLVVKETLNDSLISTFSTNEKEIGDLYSNDHYHFVLIKKFDSNLFTKPIDTGWFSFAEKPSIVLSDIGSLTYVVQEKGSMTGDLITELVHENTVVNSPKISSINGSGIVVLNESSSKTYITNSGYYTYRASFNPKTNNKVLLSNGMESVLYQSEFNEVGIYKTPNPIVNVIKSDDGRSLSFSVDGDNNQYVYFNMPGIDPSEFLYDNGKYQYTITNDALNYASSSRNISIYAKSKINNQQITVIESDTFTFENLKVCMESPTDLEVVTNEKGESRIRFKKLDLEAGKYYYYLYYKEKNNTDTLIGAIKRQDAYDVVFDDFFKDGMTQKEGSYTLVVDRYSDSINELSSKSQQFEIRKLQTPTFDKEFSTNTNLLWTSGEAIDGYKVKINNVLTKDGIDNNINVNQTELQTGETVYEISSYKSGLVIESNPLVIRLYKLDTSDLSISNSIVSLNNSLKDHININALFYLYLGSEALDDYNSTGKQLNLKTLTSDEYFSKTNDTEYKIKVTLNGESIDSYYSFIYSSFGEITFVKKGMPSIDISTSPVSERNGRSFKMAIGEEDFIYDNTNAYLIQSSEQYARFVIFGDGITTIDSNILKIQYSTN